MLTDRVINVRLSSNHMLRYVSGGIPTTLPVVFPLSIFTTPLAIHLSLVR